MFFPTDNANLFAMAPYDIDAALIEFVVSELVLSTVIPTEHLFDGAAICCVMDANKESAIGFFCGSELKLHCVYPEILPYVLAARVATDVEPNSKAAVRQCG